SFRMGNGIDMDMSNVAFAAAKKTDAGEEELIAEASSKLSTISLRTIMAFDILMDPVGIVFAGNFLLPLSSGGSAAAEVFDPQAAQLPGLDPNADLVLSMDHKKASFGVELIMAAYIAF